MNWHVRGGLGYSVGPWLVAALLAAPYCALVWTDQLAGTGGDNATYVMMAQHFSPWEEADPIAAFYTAQSQYPPLYPFVLGMIGGSSDLLIAHVATAMFFLAAMAVFCRWLLDEGLPVSISVGVPLALACFPGVYLQALSLNSEPLFVLATLVSLATAATIRRRDEAPMGGSPGTSLSARNGTQIVEVILFAALSAAVLTRSVGLVLVVAVTFSFAIARDHRRALIAAAALGPALVWRLVAEYGQGGYIESWLTLESTQGGSTFGQRVMVVIESFTAAWHKILAGRGSAQASAAASFATTGLLLVGCAGGVIRILRNRPDGWFLGFYLGVVAVWGFVWPGTIPRLLLGAVPVLVLNVHWIWQQAERVNVSKAIVFGGHAALLLAWLVGAAPNVFVSATRLMAPLPAPLESSRRTLGWLISSPERALQTVGNLTRLDAAIRDIGRFVPREGCVLSVKPSIVGFYARRRSVMPAREAKNEADFRQAVADSGCEYVVGFAWATPTYEVPYYPLRRLDGQVDVIKVWYGQGERTTILVLARLREFSQAIEPARQSGVPATRPNSG